MYTSQFTMTFPPFRFMCTTVGGFIRGPNMELRLRAPKRQLRSEGYEFTLTFNSYSIASSKCAAQSITRLPAYTERSGFIGRLPYRSAESWAAVNHRKPSTSPGFSASGAPQAHAKTAPKEW